MLEYLEGQLQEFKNEVDAQNKIDIKMD